MLILAHHFVIDDLLNGELLADVVFFKVVNRIAARFSAGAGILLSVYGAFEFGETCPRLHHQRPAGSAFFAFLEQDVVVDQLIEDIQLERERFVLRRLGAHPGSIAYGSICRPRRA